jgi:hypothetical protein
MGNFLKAICLSLLERFRKTKAAYITRHLIPIDEANSTLSPARRSAWIGSMRDSIEIVGDIISPANEESEWEALRD